MTLDADLAEHAWKQRRWGVCAACGTHGPLVLHHVVYEQVVRREKGEVYDLRNGIEVGAPFPWGGQCHCHANHHNGKRFSLTLIPQDAWDFAIELMGAPRARAWLERRYKA